jgi:hypothetical protein
MLDEATVAELGAGLRGRGNRAGASPVAYSRLYPLATRGGQSCEGQRAAPPHLLGVSFKTIQYIPSSATAARNRAASKGLRT